MFGFFASLRRVVAALNGFAERVEGVNHEWDERLDYAPAPEQIVDGTATEHDSGEDEKPKGRGGKKKSAA